MPDKTFKRDNQKDLTGIINFKKVSAGQKTKPHKAVSKGRARDQSASQDIRNSKC